jgi:peptidoglycan/LPS O-acetylase OafA/YrhL
MSVLIRDYEVLPPLQDLNPLAVILNSIGAFFAEFGESGVILFFVLSGFLLFLPYAKALLLESAWPSARRYYLRRIFRVVPSYYVTLLLILAFFHPEFLNINHWHDLWTFLTFTMSLNLSSQVNIPFWTLAIEFQFYLLLPILAWLFSLVISGDRPDRRMRKLTICLLILAIWGVVTRYLGLDVANTGPTGSSLPSILFNALKPYIYGDTGKYFDVFAVGMLLAMVYTFIQSPSAGERWKATIRQSNPFILAVGVALLVFLPLQHMTALNYGGYTLTSSFSDPHILQLVMDWMQWQVIGYSIGYGLCLWALLFGTAGLKRPFEGSLLRWFGSISFSLYMWHLPFMFIFIYAVVHNIHAQAWNPIAQYSLFWCWTLVVIIPISAAFYRWVEKPGIRLGERLIAATQAWGKERSVAQVHPLSSLNEARTITHEGWQFKGHVLVREIQRAASHGIPVPLKGDWDRIITQVPPVLPGAFRSYGAGTHRKNARRLFKRISLSAADSSDGV